MLSKEWKALQNGSDIRGVALEGVEGQAVNLTEDVVRTLGKAFALWLSEQVQKDISSLRIGVGMDSRLSGPKLKEALVSGIMELGSQVFDCGLASTPAMFMTTVTEGYEYDGAVMITASHLPFNRNGLKFFTKDGGLEKEDITNLLEIAQEGKFPKLSSPGKRTEVDFISVYAQGLVDKM